MSTAERTRPDLWEKVKAEVTESEKGGNAGEWSARKAQMAVQEYKKRGGGYRGKKPDSNHLQAWTDENWGTKSGAKSKDTGERYLPKKAREALSAEEYRRTTAKKRADTRKGRQFSPQPHDVAEKTALHRHETGTPAAEPTRGELMARAKAIGVEGRTSMSVSELKRAVDASGDGVATKSGAREPTKKALAEVAKWLGIGGTSSKSKGDLAAAIAKAIRGPAGDRMTKSDLAAVARTLHVEVRSSMRKAELQQAIASA